MKALITGGAGFVGSYLAEHLLDSGYESVTVIDNLSTGRKDNISSLLKRNGFRFFKGSIMNGELLDRLIRNADLVFHLAAAVGVRLVVEHPISTIETNIAGTEKVLRSASKYKKRVILTSTSEVYGKGVKCPFKEDDNILLGPTTKSRWSYACSKAIDEFLALAYYREKRLPVVIVRLFNTVGPRQSHRYGMVLPNFVKQALANKPITVYGDGNQTRCFCHVKDAVTALRMLAETDKTTGMVFNLGSDHEVSINELAERVKRIAGGKSRIVHVPYEEAYEEGFEDVMRRVPDISRIKRTIGFKPSFSTDDIIRDMVDFYKNNRDTW